MSGNRSIQRRLRNAPPSAAFWCGGVAAVVGFGGATFSPVILKVISIVLGVGLGILAMVLLTKNRHFDPYSWSGPTSSGPAPTDVGGGGGGT
jgi:hypothetical protein